MLPLFIKYRADLAYKKLNTKLKISLVLITIHLRKASVRLIFLVEIENNVLPFKLWVDADALPRILREVILRASDRYQLEVIFVANQNVGITPSVRIKSIQVLSGADQADKEIVDRMIENDIVITQDIPLAAQVIEKGGVAIHPRGEVYTTANVKARLHLRDFMDTLRGAGVQTGGPPPISERDKREFSSALDQTILKQKRKTAK